MFSLDLFALLLVVAVVTVLYQLIQWRSEDRILSDEGEMVPVTTVEQRPLDGRA